MSDFAHDHGDVATLFGAGLVLDTAVLTDLGLVMVPLRMTVDRLTSPARVPIAIGSKWMLRAENHQ